MDFLRWMYRLVRPTKTVLDPAAALFSIQPTVFDNRELRKTRLTSALNSVLLPELLAIVIGYAIERPYTWPPVQTTAVTTIGAKAICQRDGRARWNRLVATPAINIYGPRRWRILTEFRTGMVGYIAVGITRAPAGCGMLDGSFWSDVATSVDIMFSVNVSSRICDDDKRFIPLAKVYHAGRKSAARGFQKSVERQSITLIEFDAKRQTTTVLFRDVNGTIRQIDAVLPVPSSAIWRPCVAVSDNVDATILEWPDDVDLPAVDDPFRVDL